MKIITNFWMKPIPPRQFDWSAVTDNYDGAEDSRDPIGYGATEAEAIANLKEQLNCESCGGNDADMPCAYPSQSMNGCIRDARL